MVLWSLIENSTLILRMCDFDTLLGFEESMKLQGICSKIKVSFKVVGLFMCLRMCGKEFDSEIMFRERNLKWKIALHK